MTTNSFVFVKHWSFSQLIITSLYAILRDLLYVEQSLRLVDVPTDPKCNIPKRSLHSSLSVFNQSTVHCSKNNQRKTITFSDLHVVFCKNRTIGMVDIGHIRLSFTYQYYTLYSILINRHQKYYLHCLCIYRWGSVHTHL